MMINAFAIYFLMLTRVTSFFYTGIFFSIKGIPNILKVGFCIVFSYIIYTVLNTNIVIDENIIGFSLQIISESIYGMVLGYSTYLIFITIQMAGQLIDIQIGFSIGSVYDPMTENKVSIFGQLYYWISLALFLVADAHHFIILLIAKTYELVPVGAITFSDVNQVWFVEVFTESIKIAFQTALPLLMILLLTDIIMGMLARTVPQINVFILGMPMKVLVAITILIILIPVIIGSILNVIETLPYYLDKVIKNLN